MSTSILAIETMCTDLAVATSATGYSDSIDFSRCQGEAAILVTSLVGGATISQQCSKDNVTFYDPVVAAGTATGAVCTALAAADTPRYITFSPVLCPYTRFKIIEDGTGDLVITLRFCFREEA